jgi:hypothetical protein
MFYTIIRGFSRKVTQREMGKHLFVLHISKDCYNKYINLNIIIITYFTVVVLKNVDLVWCLT